MFTLKKGKYIPCSRNQGGAHLRNRYVSQGIEEVRPDENRPGCQSSKVNCKGPGEDLLKRVVRESRPREDIGLAGAGDEIHNQLVLEMHGCGRETLVRVDMTVATKCNVKYTTMLSYI